MINDHYTNKKKHEIFGTFILIDYALTGYAPGVYLKTEYFVPVFIQGMHLSNIGHEIIYNSEKSQEFYTKDIFLSLNIIIVIIETTPLQKYFKDVSLHLVDLHLICLQCILYFLLHLAEMFIQSLSIPHSSSQLKCGE